jgi:prenyl protein peptidase
MPIVFAFPPLSTTFAHLLSLFFAFTYVGSIYLSKNSRLSFSGKVVHTTNGQARPKEQDERWRDDPDVIKARLAAVGFATLVCCLAVIGVVGSFVGDVENVSCIGRVNGHTVTDTLFVVIVERIDHFGVLLYQTRSDIR